VKRKLIEVALPLEAINDEGSRRKRKAPAGYTTTLHKWWAQRPLAAARAVIFAQLVDDPSARPDLFATQKAQEKERQRLFKIIDDLIRWENTTNEDVLARAREEIGQSWRRACAENADHPRASELFDRERLPTFHDPFAGGGSLPLEAQRLGLRTHGSDLNPVAVLINKAMIEIPPRFAGRPPMNPEWRQKLQREKDVRTWLGARGLAEDVRHYGRWTCSEAEQRIGHLYPRVDVTADMVKERPDLRPYSGRQLTVVAWLWARTVGSPNPAFANVHVPLATTFMLSNKAGKEAYVDPLVEEGEYRLTVKAGKPRDPEAAQRGTKLTRGASFQCLMSGTPISSDYIKAEGKAGRIGTRLMAIVADGERGRVYLSPRPEHEAAARAAKPEWRPDGDVPARLTGGTCVPYGLSTWGDLFTPRQLAALSTFSVLVGEARDRIKADCVAAGWPDDDTPLRDGGTGAAAYADSVVTYLAFAVSRLADYGSSIATWRPKDGAMRSSLAKQAIQMAWDFAEGSPLADSSSGFLECVGVVAKVLECALGTTTCGVASLADAAAEATNARDLPIVSTDPPYYDNVGYADLSDFFYVWLRRSLRSVFPELLGTVAVPKGEELVAASYRHGGKVKAETFFLDGMTRALRRLVQSAHPAFPVTIYYAYKQSENEGEDRTSTGWETFLDAVSKAGFMLTGTWPMRTEGDNRQIGIGTNALASSIVLVCRARPEDAPAATRREFVAALKSELPAALDHLQRINIAPVDLAQAAIGPGMAVFTRHSRVLDAAGKQMSVGEALALINQTLDELLTAQEGDFEADSRFALSWFEQFGFGEGKFGSADVLARAKNTSVEGLKQAGVLTSKSGRVRLLKPDELPGDWDPRTDTRPTSWEMVHHLIRALDKGEAAAGELLKALGGKAEVARELAYRLYTVCERKKRAAEALAYNALVQSWPEIVRLAQGGEGARRDQGELFEE